MPAAAPKPPKSPLLGALGDKVRELRLAEEMSQERLAEGTDLHWSYIGRIERGQVNLSVTNLVRLAHVLGVRPGELLDELPSAT